MLVFAAGQTTQHIKLTINDDDIVELDESFLLVVMDSDCCVQMENNLTAKLVIADNDHGITTYININHTVCSYICTAACILAKYVIIMHVTQQK